MNNFTSLAAGALWSERKRDSKLDRPKNISQPGEASHPREFSEVSGDFFSGVDTRRNRARPQVNNSLAAVTKENSLNNPNVRSRSMNLGLNRLKKPYGYGNEEPEFKPGTSEVKEAQSYEKSIPEFLLEEAGLSTQAFVERYAFLPSSKVGSRPAKIRFTQKPLRIVRELTLEDEITAARQLTERPVDMFMRFKKIKMQKAEQPHEAHPPQSRGKPPKRSETFGATDEVNSPHRSARVNEAQDSSPPDDLDQQQPKETWKKQQTAVEKYTVKKIVKATIDALPRLLGTLMVIPKDIPDFAPTESNGRVSPGTYSVTDMNNLSKVRPSSDKMDATSIRSSFVPGEKRSRDRDSNSRKDSRVPRQSQRSVSSQGIRREQAHRHSGVQLGETVGASTSSGQELQQRSGLRSRSTDAGGSANKKQRSRQRSLSRSGWNRDGTGRRIQEHPEFKQWKGKVDAMIGGTFDPSIRKYGNLVITDLQDTLQNFGRIDRLREMIGGVVGDKAGVNGTQTSKKMVKLNPIKPRDANQPSVNTKMNGLLGDVQEVEEILRKFLATKRTPYTLDNEESEIVRKMEEIEAVLNDRAKRERLLQADSRAGDADASEDEGRGNRSVAGHSMGRVLESRDD